MKKWWLQMGSDLPALHIADLYSLGERGELIVALWNEFLCNESFVAGAYDGASIV